MTTSDVDCHSSMKNGFNFGGELFSFILNNCSRHIHLNHISGSRAN